MPNGRVDMRLHKELPKGHKGYRGLRYHPTKGYRKEKGFDPMPRRLDNLSELIVKNKAGEGA